MKLKKGDKVIVIAGKSRGKSGAILKIFTDENKVLVEGINMVKRHRKPTAQNKTGEIIEKAAPIHASNVMIVDPKTGKPTRIKITRDKDGVRTRIAVKSGKEI